MGFWILLCTAVVLAVVVLGLYATLRRHFAGEVSGSYLWLPRNADVMARVEALTAMEWAVSHERPLSQALWSVIPDVGRAQQIRLRAVAGALEDGASLGEALGRARRMFPGPLRRFLGVAEVQGVLDRVIPRVAVRGRVARAAATWAFAAALIPVFGALMAGFLLRFVVPNLTRYGASIPTPAEAALATGQTAAIVTASLAWWLPVTVFALVVMAAIGYRFDRTRRWCFALGEWLPVARGLLRLRWLADVASLGQAQLALGLPADGALAAACELEGPPGVRKALGEAVARLREGVALPEALASALPAWAAWRLRLWAAAGDAVTAMDAIAAAAADRADRAVRRAQRSIYPASVLLFGATVAAWMYFAGLHSVRLADAIVLGGLP